MEYVITRLADQNDELYHHGTKGMKWGVRRYQNKDGSLTPAGKKRYNKALETMNDESKSARARARAKKTVEKLKPAKAATEKKESVEETRSRLLNSTNAKEIYENRHLLSTNELNERINRIDTEARLKSKIVEEYEKRGVDYVNEKMQKASNTIDTANNFFRSVDQAYSTVANSAIGKTLAKQLGIETPKKKYNLEKKWLEREYIDDAGMKNLANYVTNYQKVDKFMRGDKGGKGSNNGNNPGLSEDDIESIVDDILSRRNTK